MSATATSGVPASQPAKRGRGRPTLWKAEFVEEARRLTMVGFTMDQVAEALDVSKSTFELWCYETHPEMYDAILEARHHADGKVAASLFARATGYTYVAEKVVSSKDGAEVVTYKEHCPPDVNAAMIWLKNRQPALWKDRHVNELVGPSPGEAAIEFASSDEARMKALQDRLEKILAVGKSDAAPSSGGG